MEDQIKVLNFVENGVVENPVYDGHKRAKNWACLISGKNSVSFERHFLKQNDCLVEVSNIEVGDAIEFGGDYISCGGNRSSDRRYYLVKEIKEEGIIYEEYTSIATLLKAKNKLA